MNLCESHFLKAWKVPVVEAKQLSPGAKELLKDLYQQGADKGKTEVYEVEYKVMQELDDAGLVDVTHPTANGGSPMVVLTKSGVSLAKVISAGDKMVSALNKG